MKYPSWAVELAKRTVRRVPAYKKFIRSKGISNRITDLFDLPLSDKKIYLKKYPLKDIFPFGKIPSMAYASSGSSGQPTFWFREESQEVSGTDIHEIIFRDIFGLNKKESTLVVVCFSMGVWVAGNLTTTVCRKLNNRGYNITVITPGMEREDIFNSIKNLAPKFSRLILAGYPPFLMDIITEAKNRKIKFGKKVNILTAGDKVSEVWRNHITSLVSMKDRYRTSVGIYGSADAGPMGIETPLSIFIREESLKNPKLYKDLFSNSESQPALVQYDPSKIFFEEVGGEIALTAPTAAPLIRYNIHDRGKVLSYKDMLETMSRHGIKVPSQHFKKFKWPFLILDGRTDVAVTFYAINVYPEHISSGLRDPRVSSLLSGNYLAHNHTSADSKRQSLHITVEMQPSIKKIPANSINLIREVVTEHLLKMSIEYRKLISVIGDVAKPKINIAPNGHLSMPTNRIKGIVQVSGKKPRVVISK